MLFLAGGTGFIGKSLLRFASDCASSDLELFRQPITVLSRNPDKFICANSSWLPSNVEFIKGDICDFHTLPAHNKFTHIIHAAADSCAYPPLSPLDIYRQIILGTENLLRFAVLTGVERFLYLSSGAVYGPSSTSTQLQEQKTYELPDSPNYAYAHAKRSAEYLCNLYHVEHRLQTVVARCFAFIGRDLPLHSHFAVSNFMADALSGRDIVVQGDGTSIRTYLDQADLAKWLSTLLLYGSSGSVYNVGSDQPVSIRDLACLVRDIINPSLNVVINGNNQTVPITSASSVYVPNISRAANELGLRPTISLQESISYIHSLSVPQMLEDPSTS